MSIQTLNKEILANVQGGWGFHLRDFHFECHKNNYGGTTCTGGFSTGDKHNHSGNNSGHSGHSGHSGYNHADHGGR